VLICGIAGLLNDEFLENQRVDSRRCDQVVEDAGGVEAELVGALAADQLLALEVAKIG
jgi:hypothetical protein